MTTEGLRERLARVREDHGQLRAGLKNFAQATEALELRGEVAGLGRLVEWLRRQCLEHFPLEEALAAEVLGVEAPQAMALQSEHRDLRERLRRMEALLQRAAGREVLDELWRESSNAVRALSCHLCREEQGLLPLLEFAANTAFIPAGREAQNALLVSDQAPHACRPR